MFFTQNPIGSSATEDLQDNAISFDYAMNSPAALWQDRLGKQHKTVQQALKDVGFKPAGFDFVSGGTLGIGDRDKCVFYPTDGYWYSWNGKLPYVVPANSSPTPGGNKGWKPSKLDNEYNSFFTTTAELPTKNIPIGSTVILKDRKNEHFIVESGNIFNSIDILNAGENKVARIIDLSGIKSASVFGAKLDWDGKNGTDETHIFKRMHELGVSYAMDGKFSKITETLFIKSNQKVYFLGGGFHKPNSGYIFSTMREPVDNFIAYNGHFTGNKQADLIDLTGAGPGYPRSVKNCKLIDCTAVQMYVLFNFDNARASQIIRGRYAGHTALQYTNKSAECLIDSALLIKDENWATPGTKGIRSFEGPDGYPEGLTVKDTLIFRFEHNLAIEDLFIGKFHDNYIDSGDDAKTSYINYGTKTEGIEIVDNWFYSKGLTIGKDGEIMPRQFRSSISQNHFNAMVAGTDISLNRWVHGVNISQNHHNSLQVGEHVCVVCAGNNNGIMIEGLNPIGYTQYIQMKGSGENNSLTNIVNVDKLLSPVYLEYPINVSNVEGYNVSTEGAIVPGTFVPGNVIASADNVTLSSGICQLSFDISKIVTTGNGFLKIVAYKSGTFELDENIKIPGVSGFVGFDANETAIRTGFSIVVKKATKTTFAVILETGSGHITGGNAVTDGIVIVQ